MSISITQVQHPHDLEIFILIGLPTVRIPYPNTQEFESGRRLRSDFHVLNVSTIRQDQDGFNSDTLSLLKIE